MPNPAIVISNRVLRIIQRLPEAERIAIANALASQLFLGIDSSESLSPYQAILYTFIQDYVKRDTFRSCCGA